MTFGTVLTVWYFRTVLTVWYFGTVLTVWYFITVLTVWYFGTVLTVWYVCLHSMTLCLQEAMTIRLIFSCRSSPQTQVHSISVNKKYKYPNLFIAKEYIL